ncbi:MAG: endonuclease/exonuclease/phosphatase family protein [Planctomycetota bacterium]|nr:endonuclease/exonuclease/phosphatase family protein [Planctomycetota bacterium]
MSDLSKPTFRPGLMLLAAPLLMLAAPLSALQPAAKAPPAPEAVAGHAPTGPAHDPYNLRRFGIAEPKAKAPGAIRLATYNVANLFDDKDDPNLSGEDDDLPSRKPQEELDALALTIKRLDADVLCLQEIESYDTLIWFRDTYLKGLGYEHVVSIDAGDSRGIENAVLSRVPIVDKEVWVHRALKGAHPATLRNRPNEFAGRPLTFHRTPLRVDLEAPAVEGQPAFTFSVFVVHNKSGRDFNYWREAEAQGLADLLAEFRKANPDAALAVLGDFNAEPDAKSVQTLTGAGLEDLFADVHTKGQKLAPEFVTHESGRAIDQILLSPALKARVVPESRFVLGTPARPEGVDYRRVPLPPGAPSDHYPVAVDLKGPAFGASGNAPEKDAKADRKSPTEREDSVKKGGEAVGNSKESPKSGD